MKLRTLIYVFFAISLVVLLFNLAKQHVSMGVYQRTKPAKATVFHYTTVELDLSDKDTIAVPFKTVSGKFKLDSLHHLVEIDSLTKLASEVMSFKVLSDSTVSVGSLN